MKKIYLLLVFSLLSFSVSSFANKVDVVEKDGIISIANERIDFRYDLRKGQYSIYDKADKLEKISEAYFKVNDYHSTQYKNQSWSDQPYADNLGYGMKLIIKLNDERNPGLILETIIYEENNFVALTCGIDNKFNHDIKVMSFYPMIARAYQGFEFHNYKTLDGQVGEEVTEVSTKDTLRSTDNLLITFGRKGARKNSMVFGGLTYHEFCKFAKVVKGEDHLSVSMWSNDPVGRLIDARSAYIFDKDRFYIDFSIDNRFDILEAYAFAVRKANNVDLGDLNYPILNFWYTFTPHFAGDEFKNTTVGTIEKMNEVVKTGFLKYSPMGIRLEPDDYATPNNQQGWWDDAHWQMYESGRFEKPYETVQKWGHKITEMGGVPFIYFQTARRSADYCETYPGHCLFNMPAAIRKNSMPARKNDGPYWTYDFTDPGFMQHMKEVYTNLKLAGVRGVKYDYPQDGWADEGGFEDRHATTAYAYRNIYKLAYENVGKGVDIHERLPIAGAICTGVITTWRTEPDNDWVFPMMTKKTGLRWYKNRVVAHFDQDARNPFRVFPAGSRDGVRSQFTMTYLTTGRMELGKYLEKFTPEMLHDLTRVTPMHTAPKSPRPVDAFTGLHYPKVYDFEVNNDWHILSFYNYAIDGSWPDEWGFGHKNADKVKGNLIPSKIEVSLSDATDEGGLGLQADNQYYVYDFWNNNFIGKVKGSDYFSQELRAGETRVMAIHKVQKNPQFISTNRHIFQGYVDMVEYPSWNNEKKELKGKSKVVGGETYTIIVAANGFEVVNGSAGEATLTTKVLDKKSGLMEVSISAKENTEVAWNLKFK